MLIHPVSMYKRAAGGGFTALLDESGIGSATGAFSVMKLRSAYAGNCIRVRESGGDTEANIGFSGNDLDTASLESHCGANDGFIVTWYDQSGNGNNATQSTASLQPQIVSSGTTLTGTNSKPLIRFDGTDDYLAITSLSGTATHSDGTVSAVINATAALGDILGGNNDGQGPFWRVNGSGFHTFQRTSNSSRSSDTTFTGSWALVSVTYDGSSLYFRTNGSADGTDAYNISTWDSIDAIGDLFHAAGGDPIDADMSELVFWEAEESANDSTRESNQNTRFSIY